MNLHFLVRLLDLNFTVYKALLCNYRYQGSEIDQQLRFFDYALKDCGFLVKGQSEIAKTRVGQDRTENFYLRILRNWSFHHIELVYFDSHQKWLWEMSWRWRESDHTQFLFWSKKHGGSQLIPFEGNYQQARSAFFAQFYFLLAQIERPLD